MWEKMCIRDSPKAKKYWDYRKMYEEMGKSIDGVIIATADHTHATVSYTHLKNSKVFFKLKVLRLSMKKTGD